MRDLGFRSRLAAWLASGVLLCGSFTAAQEAGDDGRKQDTEALQAQAAEPPMEPKMLEARPILPATELATDLPGGRDYVIGRQDLLEIRVFDLEELNQTVRVSDDGTITLPLLGRLQVAGLTKGDLETTIARMLEEGYVRNPQVTVFVKEFESKKVAVTGAVRKPDRYPMMGEKTLLEMISMAGGLGEDPAKTIYVFRRGEDGNTRSIPIDLERLVYEADPAQNIPVQPNDIIYVPEVRKLRIFVTGAVKNSGVYEVPEDQPVTLMRAITLAGGLTDRAAERRVQITRRGPDGERITFWVDLRKVKKGKAEDPVLQDDDMVLVPDSFF